MPWSTPFDEPIRLRGGARLVTLQHAADYVMKLPQQEQKQQRWQIAVEIINADATYHDGRLLVTLGVRATLRTRSTRTYLAQTQAYCSQGGVITAERGAAT